MVCVLYQKVLQVAEMEEGRGINMEGMNRGSGKKLLHKKEIGAMFGYGRDKTRRLLESGILPVIQINNDYVISA